MNAKLRHVVAVGQFGSFSRAAEEVGVSQSAVTKSVAETERQLGFPLFHRTSRGAIPTEQGKDFLADAARLLADSDELFRLNKVGADRFAGPLRIGIGPASMEWVVIEPAVRLLRQHPNVRLELAGGAPEKIIEQLRRGSIDVAVCPSATFLGWSEFNCLDVGAITPRLFVTKNSPLARKRSVMRVDLAQYGMIVPTHLEPFFAPVRTIYDEAGIDWRTKVYVIDHFPAVERLVQEFGLIGIVSAEYACTERFRARFQTVDCEPIFETIQYASAFRRRWTPKPAVTAFCNAMRLLLHGAGGSNAAAIKSPRRR